MKKHRKLLITGANRLSLKGPLSAKGGDFATEGTPDQQKKRLYYGVKTLII